MDGHVDLDGHRQWYRVLGDLAVEAAPVVVMCDISGHG